MKGVSERQLSDLSQTAPIWEQFVSNDDTRVLQGLALGLIDGDFGPDYFDRLTPVELELVEY